MIQKIPQTPIVRILRSEKNPIKILQGGSSSGKTYSILYRILIGCLFEWKNETIDVIRDTFPALRISAMKDWEDILKKHEIYNKSMHNKSDKEYTIGSNVVRFYSADNEEKMRGPRRHRVYFNEVLEMRRMDVEQVMMRTSKETWADFNPADQDHWFYTDYADDPENFFHVSTFRDNPFLEKEIVRRLEKYKDKDPNLWRIYGLGERGVAESTIYRNWKFATCNFEQFEGQRLFGLDFGFNDPTTLIRAKFHKKGIFAEELLYETELTSEQIVARLEALVVAGKLTYDDQIIADASRPEIIEDIKRAGFNIRRTKKGPGSILRGINFIKGFTVYIPKESVHFLKEFRGYQWKVNKQDKVLDTPVDLDDHTCDAFRYAVEMQSRKKREVGAA